ncbi:MAG: hypothetical protein SH817_12620 [Leptospira sp.]|nr:hypothetical protein [Leptospira sp.]
MKKVLFFYLGLVSFTLFLLVHSPAGLLQDSVYKYFQTIDYLDSGKIDFSIHNHNYEIDPENEFGIFKPPFAHLIHGKIFMTFPWLWVYLNAPLFSILNFYAIYLIPIFSGILSIVALRFLMIQLFDNDTLIEKSLLFYVLGTALSIYSVWYYEGNLCNLLLYTFLIFQIKSSVRESYLILTFEILASLLILNILIILRTEVYFLAILYLFAIKMDSKKNLISNLHFFLLYTFIPLFIYIYSNSLIWDTPQGLRFLVTNSFTFGDRILRIFEYFFFAKYSLLVYLPTFFLTLIFFRDLKTNFRNTLFRFYLASLVFMIILPFVSPQQQGSDLVPRFFFPVIPILVLCILYVIYEKFPNNKHILELFLYVPALSIVAFSLFLILFFNRSMDALYKKIAPFNGDQIIVSSEIIGHLVQNAEKRSVYYAPDMERLESLYSKEKIAKNRNIYFLYSKINKFNFTSSYLKSNFKKITDIGEVIVYKRKIRN